MKSLISTVVSWVIALWASKVFLSSLPYKFSDHPDTQHIFGTIGKWLGGFLGTGLGDAFSNYGAYLVGSFELITSFLLLVPIVAWLVFKLNKKPITPFRQKCHALGGLMSAMVMGGAVFFHLVSPLGVEVLHQGESDNGSLFYAALSILILGVILFLLNVRGASQTDSVSRNVT